MKIIPHDLYYFKFSADNYLIILYSVGEKSFERISEYIQEQEIMPNEYPNIFDWQK